MALATRALCIHTSQREGMGEHKQCQQYLQVSACFEKQCQYHSTSSSLCPAKQLWNLLAYFNQIRKKPRKHDKSPQRGQEAGEGEAVKTHSVASWLLLSGGERTQFENNPVPGERLQYIPPKTMC